MKHYSKNKIHKKLFKKTEKTAPATTKAARNAASSKQQAANITNIITCPFTFELVVLCHIGTLSEYVYKQQQQQPK
jgi:hypothetical protein